MDDITPSEYHRIKTTFESWRKCYEDATRLMMKKYFQDSADEDKSLRVGEYEIKFKKCYPEIDTYRLNLPANQSRLMGGGIPYDIFAWNSVLNHRVYDSLRPDQKEIVKTVLLPLNELPHIDIKYIEKKSIRRSDGGSDESIKNKSSKHPRLNGI